MSDNSGLKLFVDQLCAEGVRFVFGSPGPDSWSRLRSVEGSSDLRYVVSLHDYASTSMAAGYAQASAKPGVVDLTGPGGLARALPAILNAEAARLPMVIMVHLENLHVLNEGTRGSLALWSMMAGSCKWCCQVANIDELARGIRRAFHECISPPMGPVVVGLPADILNHTTKTRVIIPPRLSPIGGADPGFIKRAAQILVTASKVGVLIGNEVAHYHARKETVALTEVLGWPVYAEPRPCGLNFPNQHRLFGGVLPDAVDGEAKLFDGCDVILAIGVQNRDLLSRHSELIPSTAVVLQVNVDASLPGHGLPCHFLAFADLAESMSKLRAEIQLQVDNQWVLRARERAKTTAKLVDEKRHNLAHTLESPTGSSEALVRWTLSQVDKMKPAKSVLVNETGRFAAFALEVMDFQSGSSYVGSAGAAPGFALPAAIGVQLASPEYTVICISGDGNFLQYPQSLWTAAHYQLPVKALVVNNQVFGREDGKKKDTHRTGIEIREPPVSFLDLAIALGVPARSAAKLTDIEAGLKEAFSTPGPFLLELRLAH